MYTQSDRKNHLFRTYMSANLKKLQDYKPSDYSITGVSLVFDIQDNKVTVSSDINFIKNNKIADDLCLDGEDLKIIQIKIDNQILEKGKYTYKDGTLQLPVRKSSFSVQTITEIDPYGNTQLEVICIQNRPIYSM